MKKILVVLLLGMAFCAQSFNSYIVSGNQRITSPYLQGHLFVIPNGAITINMTTATLNIPAGIQKFDSVYFEPSMPITLNATVSTNIGVIWAE